MDYSCKLKLENSIFARAYRLAVPVHSCLGRLSSPSSDAYLGALLYVYNAFFQADNFYQFCSAENPLEGYELFKKSRAGSKGRCMSFLSAEYPFELLF